MTTGTGTGTGTSTKKKKGSGGGGNNVLAGDDYDTSIPPSLDQKVRVVSKLSQFDVEYERGHQLGLGAFAKVFLGVHKNTNTQYAIKRIDRSKMLWGDRDALEDEINNLITVRNGPNVVQLYEVFEEKSHCFLVMELMHGGELFDVILEKKFFTELEAMESTRCILSGLEYMHKHRIAHRDLKPENLLLTAHSDIYVKLADFGFAKKVKQENGCRTLCGTPGYLAPEILERFPSYDVKCDLWSVGVIVFLLLGGYLPFDDENEDRVFEHTRNGQYHFHPNYWKNVSKNAKNFVTKLLTVNPKKRYTATAALNDTWISNKKDSALSGTESSLGLETLRENVNKANIKNKLKTAANAVKFMNRLQALNDDFNGYLERKGEDSTTTRVVTTGGGIEKHKKHTNNKFVEDSATGQPFLNFYTLSDVLGEGGYACVYRAVHKRTGEIYAVKDINTAVLEGNAKHALKDEIAALKLLRGGPYIIRLYDTFEEPENTFMVMELCKGGDLLTRVTEKEYYTEREARKTCRILFKAMDYIHKKKVAHRDIKPENVLMVEKEDDTSIKIADFGFAKRVVKPNCLRTLCGTAQYVAPEVLDLHSPGYDHRADMWSVGVVIYILLGGYAPFDGPVHELAKVICQGDYCFHDKYWSEISVAATDMISNLLQTNPELRLSAEEALQCPWMTIDEESLTVKDLSSTQEVLSKNREKTKTDLTHVINPLNKYESLDVSFTSSLGTFEEVASRKAKRTNTDLDTLNEESISHGADATSYGIQSGVIEDSTSGKPFERLYKWGRIIEDGDFHVLREARHEQSMEIYAVKTIKLNDLETVDAVAVQDEISTLQLLKECKQIIQLHDVFEEPDYTYMILERLRGGELIDRIIEKRHYTENDARIVARNILSGVEFCHNRRIANRNIKAENIILTARDSLTDVKISDFGFAKRVLYPNSLQTQCGTEGYVAPEILEHRPAYDVQCDMWSLGIVLYILLGGYRPFRGEGEDVIRQIRYGEFKFHKRYWSNISEDAKILISRMLTVNPIGRITATAALQSDWISIANDDVLKTNTLDRNVEEMKQLKLNAVNKVKGVVNTIIATDKLKDLGKQDGKFTDF